MKSSTTKLTPQPDKLQEQFFSLESGSGSHRRSIRHRSAVANLQIFNLTLSTELSRLLLVTIEDVEHEEDIRQHQTTENHRPLPQSSELQQKRRLPRSRSAKSEKTARSPSTVTARLVNGPEKFKQETHVTLACRSPADTQCVWPEAPRNVRRLEAPTPLNETLQVEKLQNESTPSSCLHGWRET